VTTWGTSFTIRKFREEPFSPVELIENGTFNAEALVYFWLAIENNKSLLFIGGTASGKTTSLNAVSLFIPPVSKIVSIEDTREITLFHDNWIASVTREALTKGGNAINMFSLLKAAMRQRPEYVLVGEVRGEEAQTLFQAMNTGHTTFSTMHAGSVDAAIHRLESEPLNVPRNMVQALNIISVQGQIYRGTERVRRLVEIVEVAGIDPSTGNLRVNNVFTYDTIHDVYHFAGRSQVYSDIAEKRGWTRDQLEKEIAIRKHSRCDDETGDLRLHLGSNPLPCVPYRSSQGACQSFRPSQGNLMPLKDYVRKWVKRDPVRYNHLHASMISARVGMTVEQYLWRSIQISFVIGVVFGIIGYILSSVLTFQPTGRPGGIYNVLNLPVPDLILGISTVYYAQAVLVILSLIFGVYISYTALLKIPGMGKNSRETKINLTLHNAVSYMYAMRRGGHR